MPISAYLADVRRRVGSDLLLTPVVVAVIRDGNGQALLQLRSDTNTWSVPGGCIDPNEGPAQAVVRECFEETGLIVRPTRLAAVLGPLRTTYPNGDVLEMTSQVFVCEVVGGTLDSRDGESLELRWVPETEALRTWPLTELPVQALNTCGAWFAWDDRWLDFGDARVGV